MKKSKISFLLNVLILISLLLSACSNGGLPSFKTVKVSIVYGSEKQEWMTFVVDAFNQSKYRLPGGELIEIEATPMGSIESINGILEGRIQPTVWSPASSVYIPVGNAEWKKNHSEDLVVGKPNDLVLSPVVIAMWKPMAEALGWPQTAIGWEDIGNLAISTEGWSKYGYPEWGKFKFGHTHPEYSNSGLVAVIAQAYAGAGKQKGLTLSDLQAEATRKFMEDVQTSIIHYGTSTGFFANRMFENGPSYLSAAVMYENLIVNQEIKRLNGTSSQLPVVAIYPKEGAFWSNHPYAILNAPWVTDVQRDAAQVFEKYLLDKPQQEKAIEMGFRPADQTIALTAPLDAQHGVDIMQPKTILQIPSAEVIRGVETLWKETKKPVDLVIVADISGSMRGEKISAARSSLMRFIDLLNDRDRLQVITFSTQSATISELSPLGEKREDIIRRVSGIVEGGDTSLYDTTLKAYQDLLLDGDPQHIRAIVVLTDGQDTVSTNSLDSVLNVLNGGSEEGGDSIKLFTIAYGDDADKEILRSIAESTGGRSYFGTPEDIEKVYSEIATFF